MPSHMEPNDDRSVLVLARCADLAARSLADAVMTSVAALRKCPSCGLVLGRHDMDCVRTTSFGQFPDDPYYQTAEEERDQIEKSLREQNATLAAALEQSLYYIENHCDDGKTNEVRAVIRQGYIDGA